MEGFCPDFLKINRYAYVTGTRHSTHTGGLTNRQIHLPLPYVIYLQSSKPVVL